MDEAGSHGVKANQPRQETEDSAGRGVEEHGRRLLTVVGKDPRRKRQKRDQRQVRQVQPRDPSVDPSKRAKRQMMSDPEHGDDSKADGVGDELIVLAQELV